MNRTKKQPSNRALAQTAESQLAHAVDNLFYAEINLGVLHGAGPTLEATRKALKAGRVALARAQELVKRTP